MAEFMSLEEAARALGMSPEELKAKAQHREVRAFQDAGTWRFRKADVDEEARRRGLGSDPDLSLSDLDLEIPPDSDVDLAQFQLDAASSGVHGGAGTGEKDVLLDDMAVPPELTGSSSTIIGMKPAGKLPSDSDVKIVPTDAPRGASDSDVRLAQPTGLRPSDSDVTLVAESSGELKALTPEPRAQAPKTPQPGGFDPGETTLRPSPLLGSSGEVPAASRGGEPDSDSDFELSPSSVIDALQPDSGSDFELTALDASDEFEAGAPPRGPSDSDVTSAPAASSGVNLGRPSDSGINLLQGGFDLGSADSIELAPLEEEGPAPPAAPPRPAPARPAPKADPGATALPIRPGAEKDIFEDTDFEVDALDTANEDRTMQVEATSDFDIEDSDSASEVFAMDEEDADQSAATALAAAPALDEEVEAISEESDTWGAVSEEIEAPAQEAPTPSRVEVVRAPAGAGPEWGTPWVVLLGVATFFMLIAAFIGMDLVTNINEFRADGPASGLVKTFAGMFGGQ
jgi:hypothetical protein